MDNSFLGFAVKSQRNETIRGKKFMAFVHGDTAREFKVGQLNLITNNLDCRELCVLRLDYLYCDIGRLYGLATIKIIIQMSTAQRKKNRLTLFILAEGLNFFPV